MSYRRPRTGIFASVDGVEYETHSYPNNGSVTVISREVQNPAPEIFSWSEPFGLWSATVSTDRCDHLAEVVTVANHLGHECQVIDIADDGTTGLYYLGTDMAAMPRDGFIQIDAGTWAKTVNVYDIDLYRERHYDLLFESWAQSRRQERG
jgi:hypothetical protein